MMASRTLLIFCCLLLAHTAFGQARYTGMVGSSPIEMTLLPDTDGTVQGVYTYPRFNTPIALNGTLKQGTLRLEEQNVRGKATAILTIPNFTTTRQAATGTWKNLATGQQLPLTITRLGGDESTQDASATSQELLQIASLPNRYFKIALAGSPTNLGGALTAVRLFDKKTNRLVQSIPVEGQSRGLYSVGVGDFNFDGYPDFSVFESSYAGPNTSSLYYLYNPTTKRYALSSYSGVSLEFDEKAKRIYETNSCCAGSSVQKFVYKVVSNRMVLVAQHCYKWDEKTQALVERKVSACQ